MDEKGSHEMIMWIRHKGKILFCITPRYPKRSEKDEEMLRSDLRKILEPENYIFSRRVAHSPYTFDLAEIKKIPALRSNIIQWIPLEKLSLYFQGEDPPCMPHKLRLLAYQKAYTIIQKQNI